MASGIGAALLYVWPADAPSPLSTVEVTAGLVEDVIATTGSPQNRGSDGPGVARPLGDATETFARADVPVAEPPEREARLPSATPARADVMRIWESRGIGAPPGLAASDAAFVAEPVDRLWAPRREAEILSEIAEAGLHPLLIQVECRTSNCRLQLTYRLPDRSAHDPKYQALFERLGYEGSPSHPVMVATDGQGTATWLTYLVRKPAVSGP